MPIAVDVGGTFTDFVLLDERIEHFKVASTPDRPERAISNGLKRVEYDGEAYHGTTVATNAFLEKEGVETAFITNKGFEDLLFIGRQTRPELYDLFVRKPKPPLKPENCYGIDCRLDKDGNIIDELDIQRAESLAERLKEKGLSAAVCFLHSYKDPEQEKEIKKIFSKHGIPISISSEVSQEFREYERGMTTLMDAYLGPVTDRYFSSLKDIFGREPYIMKSGGGLEKAETVNAVDTLYSGPAGGVAGAEYLSQMLEIDNMVTFDMGGTSADMATIVDGKLSWKDSGKIDDFPLQSKMVDIVTVGSGGGSTAYKDEGGALKVGPESAGAEPGPVCYGRGGEKPTVTDALLNMGYIDPDYFLGGEMELDEKDAKSALLQLSDRLGMEYEETLLGIFRVVNSKMARTMKKITIEKGLDPEDFSILAFGGAGPLHAASLAEELGIHRVIVPPMPGVFSALGMLCGDVVHDYSKSLLVSIEEEETIEEAIDGLKEEAGKGDKEHDVLLGLRYKGQSYHINIPYEIGKRKEAEERFHQEHRKKYGYANRGQEIEVVRVQLEVREGKRLDSFPVPYMNKEETGKVGTRGCLFKGGWKETEIYKRDKLSSDIDGTGPAIIEDENSTILVPEDWRWYTDENGIVFMER